MLQGSGAASWVCFSIRRCHVCEEALPTTGMQSLKTGNDRENGAGDAVVFVDYPSAG